MKMEPTTPTLPHHESAPVNRILCHPEPSPIMQQEEPPSPLHNYNLIKVLGHGSTATVFLATTTCSSEKAPSVTAYMDMEEEKDDDDDQKELFALKIMSKTSLAKSGCADRVLAEKEALCAISSSSPSSHMSLFLPSLREYFETQRYHVFVMDFCSGGNLNSVRQLQPEKKFSEAAARFYGAEIVLALEYLHNLGFVYRDLKPENVLIRSTGHIMLADFDLSLKMPVTEQQLIETWSDKSGCFNSSLIRTKHLKRAFSIDSTQRRHPSSVDDKTDGSSYVTSKMHKRRVVPQDLRHQRKYREAKPKKRSNSLVGTEEYVAPEILWGTGHGYAVDWWTLGVLLYELVYGTTPFKSQSRNQTFFNIMSKEPKFYGPWSPLHDLIAELLIKQPERRLGFNGGVHDIKSHPFFDGVVWDNLSHISCPPYIPTPYNLTRGSGSDGIGIDLEEQLAMARLLRAQFKSRANFDPSSPIKAQLASLNIDNQEQGLVLHKFDVGDKGHANFVDQSQSVTNQVNNM